MRIYKAIIETIDTTSASVVLIFNWIVVSSRLIGFWDQVFLLLVRHILCGHNRLRLFSSSRLRLFRCPNGLEVDLSSWFAFPKDCVPLIDTCIDAKLLKFDIKLANFIVVYYVSLAHDDFHFILHTCHLEREGFIPNWSLACSILSLCAEILGARWDLAVWIHFTERFRVSGQFSLDDSQG